jgi:hypothetical protein
VPLGNRKPTRSIARVIWVNAKTLPAGTDTLRVEVLRIVGDRPRLERRWVNCLADAAATSGSWGILKNPCAPIATCTPPAERAGL